MVILVYAQDYDIHTIGIHKIPLQPRQTYAKARAMKPCRNLSTPNQNIPMNDRREISNRTWPVQRPRPLSCGEVATKKKKKKKEETKRRCETQKLEKLSDINSKTLLFIPLHSSPPPTEKAFKSSFLSFVPSVMFFFLLAPKT